MGATFGTATEKFGSGTEEEFRAALDLQRADGRPKICFFFKEQQIKSSSLTTESLAQLMKMQDFRTEIGKLGLYRQFEEDHTFSTLVSGAISKFIDDDHSLDATHVQFGFGLDVIQPGTTISKSFTRESLSTIDDNLTPGGAPLALHEIWIEPELRDFAQAENSSFPRPGLGFKSLGEYFHTPGNTLSISGGETSGKTCICRQLFRDLFARNLVPILVDGSKINNPRIDRFRRRMLVSLREQYEGISQTDESVFREKAVVIVDDYDLAKLSRPHAVEFLNALRETFYGVVVTVSLGYEFQFLEHIQGEAVAFGTIRRLEICDLGPKSRYALIERWCEALSSQAIKVDRHMIEDRRKIVDRVLGFNLVPRTPFMVLILLQAIDAGKESDLTKTGYIRYYKFLIDSAILRNVTPKDAEGAYALLPELAWAMYDSDTKVLPAASAEQVIERFSERKALSKSLLYSVLGSLHSERRSNIAPMQRDTANDVAFTMVRLGCASSLA